MSLQIADRTFKYVNIYDDNKDSRDSFEWVIEDLGLEPCPKDGPIGDIDSIVSNISKETAALCDYRLFGGPYANYDGAELAAALYQAKVPVILATRWEEDCIVEMRQHRPYVPSLVKPADVQPETLLRSYELCVNEFNGKYSDERFPWRTLIRFQEVQDHFVFVVVPAWTSREGFKLQKSDLPVELRERAAENFRCHAKVNIGAERHEDVYFMDWESC